MKRLIDATGGSEIGRPLALLDKRFSGSDWCLFSQPRGVIEAYRADQVWDVVQAAEAQAREGYHVVGFVSYEAASGLSPDLLTHPQRGLPLAWFCSFGQRDSVSPDLLRPTRDVLPKFWQSSIGREDHAAGVARIRRLIARGETYQVNYTYSLQSAFSDSALDLFRQIANAQHGGLSAFLDLGSNVVCSASPELFFDYRPAPLDSSLDGGLHSLVSQPMKGTRPRGRTHEQDRQLAQDLRTSAKEQAENLMIVDMIRNDMGQIAEVGSVGVERLFEVVAYPSVLQMISTVTAKTRRSRAETLKALFPCASITGAPKVRTMELIRQLEPEPRSLYTGAIGYMAPSGGAVFSVAIRTVHIDKDKQLARYGTGGGITWDSVADAEWRESRAKTSILLSRARPQELFETLRLEPNRGYLLLGRHLDRITHSAKRLGIPFDRTEAEALLNALKAQVAKPRSAPSLGPLRVKLELFSDGRLNLHSDPLSPRKGEWRLDWASERVDSTDLRLHHKCRDRRPYDLARSNSQADDTLLVNEEGEVTESTIANLILVQSRRLTTPRWQAGLLRGTLRQELLDRGIIEEAKITPSDVEQADALFLVNSVRGWIPCKVQRRPTNREPISRTPATKTTRL